MGTLHVCFADLPKYGAALNANKNADVIVTSDVVAAGDAENDDAITMQRRQHLSVSPSSSSSVSPTPRYERNMGFFQQLSRRFGLRSSDDLVYNAEDDSTDSCSSTTGTMPPMQSSSATSTSSTASRRNGSNGDTLKDVVQHGSSLEHISCASSETSSTVDIEDQQQQQQQQQHQGVNSKHSIENKERKSATRSSFSRLHRRSTSSLRRAFESFSLSSRSLSCSGTTPPPQQHDSSNGSTPIKSALKSSSNIELNKKSSITTASSVSYSTTTLSSTSSSSSKSSSKSKSKPPPQRILRQPVAYTYLKGISGLPTQRVPRSAVCCQYARR